MSREAELEAVIKYYKDLEDVWGCELYDFDKKELARAEAEYNKLLKEKEAELEAIIKYYKNLSLWEELTEGEKARLAKAKRELKGYESKNRPTR